MKKPLEASKEHMKEDLFSRLKVTYKSPKSCYIYMFLLVLRQNWLRNALYNQKYLWDHFMRDMELDFDGNVSYWTWKISLLEFGKWYMWYSQWSLVQV